MTPDDDGGMVRITVRYPDGMTMTFDLEPALLRAELSDMNDTILRLLPNHLAGEAVPDA